MSFKVTRAEFDQVTGELRRTSERLDQAERDIAALQTEIEDMTKASAKALQNIIDGIRIETQRQTDVVASGVTAISKLVEEIRKHVPEDADNVEQEQIDNLHGLLDKIKENTDGLAAAIPAGTPKDPAQYEAAGGAAVADHPDDRAAAAAEASASPSSTGPGATGPDSPQSRQIDESGGQQRGSAQDIPDRAKQEVPGNPQGIPAAMGDANKPPSQGG